MQNFKYNDQHWENMLSKVKKEGKKRRFIKRVRILSGIATMFFVLTFAVSTSFDSKENEENNTPRKYDIKIIASDDEEEEFEIYVASLDNVIYDYDLGAIPIY